MPAEIVATEDAQVAHAGPICKGTWAQVQGGAGDTYDFTRIGTTMFADIQCCGTADQYQSITRIILAFPTTSVAAGTLPGPNPYVKVTLSGNPTTTLSTGGLSLAGATPANPALMVYTDYAQVGDVAYSGVLGDLATLAQYDEIRFVLNNEGIAALQTAIDAQTPFCVSLRLQADRLNAEPTWASGAKGQIDIYSADHATTRYRPVLSITGGVEVSVTGQLANSADAVAVEMWLLEVFT